MSWLFRDNEPMKILMLCCWFMVPPYFVDDDVAPNFMLILSCRCYLLSCCWSLISCHWSLVVVDI
jgi:hypothetical protein